MSFIHLPKSRKKEEIEKILLKQEIANSKIPCLVKKGWVAKYSMPLIECPDCHIGFIPPEELRISMLNYCPNCGRKMDGGEAE